LTNAAPTARRRIDGSNKDAVGRLRTFGGLGVRVGAGRADPETAAGRAGRACSLTPACLTRRWAGHLIAGVGVGTGAGDHVVQDPDEQSGRHEEGHDGGDEDDVGHAGLLEPVRLEHRDAQVDEHHDRDGEQDALSDSHEPTSP
jgi:hypothetical protein